MSCFLKLLAAAAILWLVTWPAAGNDDATRMVEIMQRARARLEDARKLSGEMRALSDSLAGAQQPLANLQRQGLKNNADYEDGRREAARLERETRELRQQVREMETRLTAESRSLESHAQVQAELAAARQGCMEAEQLLVDMAANRLALQKRAETARLELRELEQQARSFRTSEDELRRLQTALDFEQSRRSGLLQQVEQQTAAVDKSAREALALERQQAELVESLAQARVRVEQAEQARAALQELRGELQQLETRAAELTQAQREHERQRDNFTRQLHDGRKENLALEEQSQAMDALLQQIENLQNQKQAMEQSVEEQLRKNSDLETLLQAMREEVAYRRDDNRAIQQRIRNMRSVKRDLASARTQREQMEERMQSVLKDWARLQDDASALRETLETGAAESRALTDELLRHEEMRQEAERLRLALDTMDGEANTIISDQQSARDRLRQLQNKFSVLRDVLNGLSSQISSLLPLRDELARERERSRNLELRLQALEGPAQAIETAPATDAAAMVERERTLIAGARRTIEEMSAEPAADRGVAENRGDEHYRAGIERWDAGDVDGAIVEFKQALRYNKEAAGAYYNLGVVYAHKGESARACQYGYQAGLCYLRHDNRSQALRMLLFLQTIDASSPLIGKLRAALAQARIVD